MDAPRLGRPHARRPDEDLITVLRALYVTEVAALVGRRVLPLDPATPRKFRVFPEVFLEVQLRPFAGESGHLSGRSSSEAIKADGHPFRRRRPRWDALTSCCRPSPPWPPSRLKPGIRRRSRSSAPRRRRSARGQSPRTSRSARGRPHRCSASRRHGSA
jgi:hypothetical protein